MASDLTGLNQLGVHEFEAAVTAIGSVACGLPTIMVETSEYCQKSTDRARTFSANLLNAKKIDDIADVQLNYFKLAFDDYVEQTITVEAFLADLLDTAMNSANVSVTARNSIAIPPVGL